MQGTKFRYIIRGNGYKAVAVHSDMNLLEFQDYVREHSEKIHPSCRDFVFRIGVIELVNPEVMTIGDFADWCPFLIGIE